MIAQCLKSNMFANDVRVKNCAWLMETAKKLNPPLPTGKSTIISTVTLFSSARLRPIIHLTTTKPRNFHVKPLPVVF